MLSFLSLVGNSYNPMLPHADAGNDGQRKAATASQVFQPEASALQSDQRGKDLSMLPFHLLCVMFSLHAVTEVGPPWLFHGHCLAALLFWGTTLCCPFPLSLILQVVEAND